MVKRWTKSKAKAKGFDQFTRTLIISVSFSPITLTSLCVPGSVKDEELRQMAATQKEQAEQAQKSLDDFRLQVENSSAKMYHDMKTEVWLICS